MRRNRRYHEYYCWYDKKISSHLCFDDVNHASTTYYSYDVHGNVGELLQDYQKGVMAANGNRFKKIVYDYDLISGKVNEVAYQPGAVDAFYHRYSYDAENRLTEVETGSDAVYWERDAAYEYYAHGPLSRTVLGEQQVQGVDYSYTLQGWLKSINRTAANLSLTGTGCAEGTGPDILRVTDRTGDNPPAHYEAGSEINFEEDFINGAYDYFDATVDHNLRACADNTGTTDFGTAGTESGEVARDAYNVILNYYEDDYKGIGVQSPSYGMSAKLGTDYRPLYNGNISSMAVNVGKLGTPMVSAFTYDQLNRLVNVNAYKTSDEVWSVLTPTNDFKEALSYDANGNILSYLRNGTGTKQSLNNYSYTYTPNTNRLASITNSVNNSTSTYGYDAIGNVTKDDKQNVTANNWNVHGKLQSVQKTDGTNITYTYDAVGNRISKTVGNVTEWYVRDATGNIMSVYKVDPTVKSGHLMLTEVQKYGSGRLGTYKPYNLDVTVTPANTIPLANGTTGYAYSFTRGLTEYELSDGNSNVLSVVSDKKLQHTSDNTTVDYYLADVITAQRYSSFGVISLSFNGSSLKQAFNGQRRSMEVSPTAQTAEFWEYNGDVGRRWNLDPVVKEFESPYATFSNNPIARVDVLGDADTTVNEAGGGHTIKTDNAVNSLQFYSSSDYWVNGTKTKVPVQPGQLRSFSNALGTFNASWKTDEGGNPVFAGYLNNKGQTLDAAINQYSELISSTKFKVLNYLRGFTDPLYEKSQRDPVGYVNSLMLMHLMMYTPGAGEVLGGGRNFTVVTQESMSALGSLKFANTEFTSVNWMLNPNEINFMQSSIKNITGEYTVLGNAKALKSGTLNPELLRMNVWRDVNGKIWTLDHRRLAAFRLSGLQEAPIQWANPNEQMWKMSTKNGGASIWLKFGGGNGLTVR